LQPLFVLVVGMSESKQSSYLHTSTIDLLKSALQNTDQKIQKEILVELRGFVTAGLAQPSSPMYKISLKYLQRLGCDIVELLRRACREEVVAEESTLIVSEAIRLLVLCETIANQSDTTLLSFLVPSLIGLLRPSTPNIMHELSLQVLIKLATTSSHFKTQAALISEHEKQQFEESIKVSAAQQEQQAKRAEIAASTTGTKPSLKLDFSKYS